MKKIYVTPTLEVFEYIPEGQLLMTSKVDAELESDEELGNDDDGFGWTNKRQSDANWGKSPWE